MCWDVLGNMEGNDEMSFVGDLWCECVVVFVVIGFCVRLGLGGVCVWGGVWNWGFLWYYCDCLVVWGKFVVGGCGGDGGNWWFVVWCWDYLVVGVDGGGFIVVGG